MSMQVVHSPCRGSPNNTQVRGAVSPINRAPTTVGLAVTPRAAALADRNHSTWKLQAATASPAVLAIGTPLSALDSCVYLDWNATTPIYPEV